jgi:hypothetical protein
MPVVPHKSSRTRTCISCGSELTKSTRAKEHVIADWLLEAVGMREDELYQVVANSERKTVEKDRKHAFDSFREGRVCSQCNAGWMSDLENKAKPILLPLINDESSILGLTDAECVIAARWAVKTAAILSYATPIQRFLDPSFLRVLMENPTAVPLSVGVFAMQQTATKNFCYLQRICWPSVIEEGSTELKELSNAPKVAFQLNNLFLLVACPPQIPCCFMLACGLHIPLWPLSPVQIFAAHRYGLKDAPPPLDSLNLLLGFSDSLGIVPLSRIIESP